MPTTFIDLRINNAEQFKESVSEPEPNTKIYITFGRAIPWANDASPPNANSAIATVYELWDGMIGGKRLYGSDFSFAIPRYDWVANTVYTAYDHMNSNLFSTQFYVMTDDRGVYKCLSNNNSKVSTVKPTSLNTTDTTTTADGYTWKYMFTVEDSGILRFSTPNYIPVKTLAVNDGSLQWQVQANAQPGAIHSIQLENGGTGFSNANSIYISISGDGSYAAALPTVNTISNTVNAIVITNTGSGYTWADVVIEDSLSIGTGATARAIISPPGGHGSDPLYELGGKNVLVNARLKYDENGIFPVSNDYRQIALLKDPHVIGTSNVFSGVAFLQATSLTTSGAGDYLLDETVYQGVSVESSTFSGKVVNWDSANSRLILINTLGTPVAAKPLIGTSSYTIQSVASITEGDLKKHSGRILYSDNFTPITRDSSQIEEFKLVLKY